MAKEKIEIIYNEKAAFIEMQNNPRRLFVRGIGNSMTPLLISREVVVVDPVTDDVVLSKGDVVLAKVNGRVYLHKITALKGSQVQISNNHGHVNGWTPKDKVVGRVILHG